MNRPDHVRASDADRDRVATQLRDALTDGRLDPEEFQGRIELAYRARTFGELNPLIDDLVVPAPDPVPPPPPDPTPPSPQVVIQQLAPPPATDGLSITSFVLALVSLVPGLGILTAPLAVVFGGVGLARTGDGKVPGRALAMAGLILGIIAVVFYLVMWAEFSDF